MKWAIRIFGAIAVIAALILIGFSFMNDSIRGRTRIETYEVYSNYLNADLKERDNSAPNSDIPGWPATSKTANILIVIQDKTQRSPADAGNGILNGFRSLLFGNLRAHNRVSSVGTATYWNFVLRNLWTEFLEDSSFKLNIRHKLATTAETDLLYRRPNEFDRLFPEAYGYFTFSAVGFNSLHTEAYFYAEHQFGMAGHGNYVLMQKINGRWHTVQTQYTWVS